MLVGKLKGGEEALYEDLDVLSRAFYTSRGHDPVGLVVNTGMSSKGLQGAMQEAAARLSRVRTMR